MVIVNGHGEWLWWMAMVNGHDKGHGEWLWWMVMVNGHDKGHSEWLWWMVMVNGHHNGFGIFYCIFIRQEGRGSYKYNQLNFTFLTRMMFP